MVAGPERLGEMVRLRPMRPSDAPRLGELVQDPEAMRLTGSTRTYTPEEIQQWLDEAPTLEGRYDWAITSAVQRDGVFVADEMFGEIVLDEIDTENSTANLRLNLLPNYRGRGYGREAIARVLTYAFAPDGLGLHRVSLRVLSINPRARMLYESLGFTVEGTLREAVRDGEGWADLVVMGILADEHEEPGPQDDVAL